MPLKTDLRGIFCVQNTTQVKTWYNKSMYKDMKETVARTWWHLFKVCWQSKSTVKLTQIGQHLVWPNVAHREHYTAFDSGLMPKIIYSKKNFKKPSVFPY